MSTNVSLDGTSYTIPAPSETVWATQLTAYFIALATSVTNRLRFDASQTLTAPQKTQAQTNLGLGGASILSVGRTAGTVKAGDNLEFETQTLSGTLTMTITSYSRQTINPNGANRIIKLPTTSVLVGQRYTIFNNDPTYSLTIQSSDSDVIIIFKQGTFVFEALQSTPTDGTHWKIVSGRSTVRTYNVGGFTTGVLAPFKYDTVEGNENTDYSVSTGLWTAPFSGDVVISCCTNQTAMGLFIYLNGTSVGQIADRQAQLGLGSMLLSVAKGDTIGQYTDTVAVVGAGTSATRYERLEISLKI